MGEGYKRGNSYTAGQESVLWQALLVLQKEWREQFWTDRERRGDCGERRLIKMSRRWRAGGDWLLEWVVDAKIIAGWRAKDYLANDVIGGRPWSGCWVGA